MFGCASCACFIGIFRLLGRIGVTPTESGFAVLITAVLFAVDEIVSSRSAASGEIILKLEAILNHLEKRSDKADGFL